MKLSSLFSQILKENAPQAAARISGSPAYPRLRGMVRFFRTPLGGILIEAEVTGLPCSSGACFYGMHIHENGDCTPPFDKTGMHYNPGKKPHPQHAGDLLPLFGSGGTAWSAFYDGQLTVRELIGRSVVIHAKRDDFTFQPAGDSGEKIGCGTIIRIRK